MPDVATVLFEDAAWSRFLPLVYTRPVFDLICGMSTLRRKAEKLGPLEGLWCRGPVADSLASNGPEPVNRPLSGATLLLNGRGRWTGLPATQPGEGSWVGIVGAEEPLACLFVEPDLAAKLDPEKLLALQVDDPLIADLPRRDVSELVTMLAWPWRLLHTHTSALGEDLTAALPTSIHAGWVNKGSHLLNASAIHLGPKSRVWPTAVLDAENGPIRIGAGAQVRPHTYVEGPAFIGAQTLLQPGAKLSAGSYVGPVCKVGGEIDASIIHSYSNKQHDGFLGHAYVGSWVNIAADCINSDLKNTYGTVRVPLLGVPRETGEMFMGALIGDHAKIGINVGMPTGAVIGFCSSVFAPQSPKFVPSFTWIDGPRREHYDPERGLQVAHRVMQRRQVELTAADEAAFRHAYQLAQQLENPDDSESSAMPTGDEW